MKRSTLDYLRALQDWRARIGFVLGAACGRTPLPSGVARHFNGWVHGGYSGENGSFHLRPGTMDAFTVHPGHEVATHAAIREAFGQPGGVMLDVGGYCGSFSLRYKGLFDRFVVFEPFPDNIAAIERNVALNRLQDRVHLVKAAAAEREGVQQLFLTAEDTHSLVPGATTKTLEVPVVTVDQALARLGIPIADVRFIKVDVEGGELGVLEGAENTLRQARPTLILEANSPAHERSLVQFLAARGYALRARLDQRNLLLSAA